MTSVVEKVAEELTPAYMMSLVMDRLYLEGYEIRLDTRGYLDNSMRARLGKVTGNNHLLVAKATDRMGSDLLRDVDFDDSRVALLAVSYFVLKLVDEKLFLDVKDQSVLSALMVVADAEADENPEFNSAMIQTARLKAAKMLDRALQRGLYLHTVVSN